jgi:hypothetical protein
MTGIARKPSPTCIDRHLQVPQESRGVLDLVDDHGIRIDQERQSGQSGGLFAVCAGRE